MLGISRCRLSQILRLLDLRPEVQEDVLLGEKRVAERRLRGLTNRVLWEEG